MTGCGLSVQVHPAHITDGKVRATIHVLARTDEFAERPDRTVLVGGHDAGDHTLLLETHDLRSHQPSTGKVSFPAAYELDDLTYGVLCAASSVDDALQADDQALAETRADLAAYERLSASAVSREAAPGLNAVGQMWLGSGFLRPAHPAGTPDGRTPVHRSRR